MKNAGATVSTTWSSRAPPLGQGPQVPLSADWERLKGTIYALYIVKRLRLKDVVARMERDHAFKATERMFKTRLGQWGYLKKMRDIDWQAVAVLRKHREQSGQKTIAFKVHGRKIRLAEFRKYLKDRKISEHDLLNEAADNDITSQTIPADILCFTSSASLGSQPPPNSSHDSSSTPEQTPVRGLSGTTVCGSISPAMSVSPLSESFEIVDKPSSTSSGESGSEHPISGTVAISGQSSSDHLLSIGSNIAVDGLSPTELAAPFCDQVQHDLGQLVVRGLTPDSVDLGPEIAVIEPWTFLNSQEDTGSPSVLCSRCHIQISDHLPFPSDFLLGKEDFMPRSIFFHDVHLASQISHDADLGIIWMACCFGACMFVRQQDFDFVAKSLSRADAAFEQMIRTRNSALFTSLNSTLTIMHAHDQGKMAMSVLRSTLHVAQNLLGMENPISVAIEWMTALAWKQLPQCRVKTDHLRTIYHQFGIVYGPKHPHTLAILYNLAFSLICDKQLLEAETCLRQLYQDSRLTLGPSHLQTITALMTLSRALSNQNKFAEAVEVRKQALEISRRTLGPNHPHHLESMRRLALTYEKQGEHELMEPIYWAVLKGRIKSLGPKHDFTEGAMEDLIELLQKLGKWDSGGEMKETIDKLFVGVDEASTDHHAFLRGF